ncbi:MAG TPA: heme o synthase [Sporichthyaceae bacterium]|nr:heme o synthase [Sporichthyaceae bacterium]
MTTVDLRPTNGAAIGGGRSMGATLRAYVALTKPRIIELLLVTTAPVMFLAARGVPSLWLVVATLVGGTLSAGSANVLNCYLDRDIDADMRRTRRRPLPMHGVTPRETLVFGVVLGAVSTLLLGLAVNWLSALLALTANLFYVFGYTMWLKRRTSQNIVWGGAAGCFPPLIGWTAVTGSVSWAPIVLFGVVFFWTPPHFWALAMRYREDYAAAKVPMLPVVATELRVITEITFYTWATVIVSMLLWPVAHTGPLYPAVAAVLGVGILLEAHRLLRRVRRGVTGVDLNPMRLFHLSNTYLALLFLVIAIDACIF